MHQANGHILLFHLSGPMSFSSAKAMVRLHADINDYDVMLLDLSDTSAIDYTSSRAIDDIIVDCTHAGRSVLLVGAQADVHAMLERQRVIRHFDESCIYKNRIDALRDAMKHLDSNH